MAPLCHGIPGLAISTISVGVELAILELLARHDRLAVDRIADAVGASQRAVASGIRQLAEQGLIRRVGETDWRLRTPGVTKFGIGFAPQGVAA